MSLDKIQQLISSITNTIEDNHKIATPVLAVKLAKSLELYPHDQTLGTMLRVIDQMAANNTLFISRGDLKSLYQKLYSTNTKFAQLFSDELGIVEAPKEVKTASRDDSTNLNFYEVADPILSNALNSVFDKNIPLKLYSQALANKAVVSVNTDLDSWGLKPTSLAVCDGNDKFLVLKADYETPKGITSFYVPIEVVDNKISEASVFMGNLGPQELNHNNVKDYITANAGSKLKISAANILGVLTKAASENREISDAELALTRLYATRQGKAEFSQGQIIGQKVDEAAKGDIVFPKSDEFVSFEKRFSTPTGFATFKFGKDTINIVRNNIMRELVSMGYSNAQLAISDVNENTVFYSVSLDGGKVAFVVPVKITNGRVNKPSVFLCNGSVSVFEKENIDNLYVNNESDYKAAAIASPLFDLKPSELIDNIRSAVSEGNVAKAEDALNVLANSGDAKAYATGFQAFVHGLGTKRVEASSANHCNMIISDSKVSKYQICGHTGLPLHKVYQDKDGNCRPLYRRGMDETYEGASFMNAKIFG
jgi:hypothetical protein